jgi:hypothetical protein
MSVIYVDAVTCTIMQKNGAGLHSASSCYWDNSTDGSFISHRKHHVQVRLQDHGSYCQCFWSGNLIDLFQITPASVLSFAISSSTSATFPPPTLLGGSTTLITSRVDFTSIPRSWGVTLSSGFFFAFIILGRVAYLGSLSLILYTQTSNPRLQWLAM